MNWKRIVGELMAAGHSPDTVLEFNLAQTRATLEAIHAARQEQLEMLKACATMPRL